MPTSLAEQLNRLKTPQTSLFTHKKYKASFLFDKKEAANFDRDTIYELGLSGLEELKKLNPHFSIFEDTLFDVTSRTFERSVKSKEANEKLDSHIKTFLVLLSPYFLLKPAHKALEWLIQRFHIQDFNVDDILFLILPYHETILFARMVQLLPLKSDAGKWHWLYPVKRDGIPLSKTALLNRASTDMPFLKFVCNMPIEAIKISGNKASSLGTLYAFYCTTVIGGLEYAKPITELHVSHILPSIMSALGSSLPDFIASGYMIIARLATKACLSEKIFEGLLNKISKVDSVKMRSETTLVLVLLCQNNESKYRFPAKAVRRIGKEQWFLTSLSNFNNNQIVALPLILSMLQTSLQMILNGDEEMKPFVQNILSSIHFDSSDAEDIFTCLLREFNGRCDPDILNWYSELIKEFENTFPKEFDKTLSEALNNNSKAAHSIKNLLGITTTRNDLYQKLVHPNENVRIAAIENIRKHYKPDQLSWLKGPLLERLKDDCPNVVNSILNLPNEFFIDGTSTDKLNSYFINIIDKFGATNSSVLKEVGIKLIINNNENNATLTLMVMCSNAALKDVLRNFKESNIAIPDCLEIFVELQNCLDKCKKNLGKFLWSVLKNSKSLPSCEEIINTFNKYEELKKYSGFWFITSVLVSITLQDEFETVLVNKLITFFMDYLKFPKLQSTGNKYDSEAFDKEFGELLHSSQKNHLPVEGALFGLSVIMKKMLKQKKSSSQWQWYNFNDVDNSILLSIYKIIQKGNLVKNANIKEKFHKFGHDFLKAQFRSEEYQLNFIINAIIFDENLALNGLNLISELLTSYEMYPKVMKKESIALPGLLLLLSFKEDEVRNSALEILKHCSQYDGFYKPLASELIETSEEIRFDHEQIAVMLYSKLSPSEEIKSILKSSQYGIMQTILDQFLLLITSSDTPDYIRAKFLKILELVQSKEMFIRLMPLAMELIGESRVLNKDESDIACYIIKRFNEVSIDCLQNEEIWLMIEKIIEDHMTELINIDSNKSTCPSALLLKQISLELFEKMPKPAISNQERLLSLVTRYAADTEKIEVINLSAQLFKRIIIDCKILVNLLAPMVNVEVPVSPEKVGAKSKRRSAITPPSIEILGTQEWKQGVCLLELIQNKKKLLSTELLIPSLFKILKKCLEFEQQTPLEYTKQLVLSSILNVVEHLPLNKKLALSKEMLQVDLIVNCIRVSHNPQTHHHALLALAYIAELIPDQVLHNIMAIFTFIGSSILRQDDAYSFQIITKIIDTIIPVLIKVDNNKDKALGVAEVVRVFVAALLDVPEHRRIPLLIKLMNTVDASTYLWVFLCLVFESHVLRPTIKTDIEIKVSGLDEPIVAKKLEIAHQLCSEFPPEIILNTSYKLLDHLCSLPHDKDEKELHKFKDKLSNFIFNLETNTGKQLRHYKYTLLIFLSSLLSSNNFVQQLAELTHDEHAALEHCFSDIVKQNLLYIKSVSKQCEECSNLPTAKYWKAVLNQAYDILDKTNALLPTEGFLRIINYLLRNDLEAVRRKAMELLGWRLQQPRPVPVDTLMKLLSPLEQCLDSINLKEDCNQELQLTQQTALFSLKLMARHLAQLHPDRFIQILQKITDILCSEELSINWSVLGSLVLCLGELAYLLKDRTLVLLNKFMPALLNILHKHNKKDREELLLISIVTAIQKIVDALIHLLSPFLSKLLYEICLLSAEYEEQSSDNQKIAPLVQKLKLIRQKISSDSPGRVLVPALSTCYKKLIKQNKYSGVGPLMIILSDSFTSSADLTVEVTALLLTALDFRSVCSDENLPPSVVNTVEDPVINAFTQLVLKITESAFRPLYTKVYDWALRSQGDKQRAITFFRLSSQIATSLKSLFTLFAGIFITNAAELLDMNNVNNNEAWFEGEYVEEKACILVDSILKTLITIFRFDSQKFVTKDRFNKIMQPLVEQVENKLGGEEIWKVRCNSLITPCISQMATSIIDDSLWKKLNYQILLKMRHENSEVRLVAVRTVCALASKLGEDFLPLLPETVPFLAELLEDDDENVERECQRVVNEMEEIIGEPIQKYF